MGLDMYLYANKHLTGYDYDWKTDVPLPTPEFDAILTVTGLERTDFQTDMPSVQLSFKVGYWRKQNAIHNWFVDSVGGGEDNCRPYYVSRSDLDELVSLCQSALADKNPDILPPMSGFFFGSTEVDDTYWWSIQYTLDMVSAILDNPKFADCDFEYQASW
jgi:hypothetical protein